MGEKPTGGSLVEKFGIPWLVVVWYSCSIIGNNAGKVVLPLFPYPYTLSIMQFSMGAFSVPIGFALKGRGVRHLPGLIRRCARRGFLLGVAGIGSNLFHRVALVYITVSFEHTVKATQPLFSGMLDLSGLMGLNF